uniref:Enoyl reductase (ER) domain-containing protein n=1 Tax=Catagonus wagneri TaxID=51154 RepID=A0A8C3YGX5_9CETA
QRSAAQSWRMPPAWGRVTCPGLGCSRHYRAVLCSELKQPLTVEEVAPRPVGPQEVRVDIHFSGVNFADTLLCRGLYQERPQVPFIPGVNGKGVRLNMPLLVFSSQGDGVVGISSLNSMAEECITDHQVALWQIPEGVSLQEAAVLPITYGTATFALEHRAHTQPGETVLVTAASGATGLAVIDVATNVLQAKVIAAAGSEEKCKLAMQRAPGSAHWGSWWAAEGWAWSSTPWGDVFLEALRSLAWEGRIVVVGFAGGTIPSLPANLLLLKNISATGLLLSLYWERNFPLYSRTLSSAIQYCHEGCIHPHIGAVFKLEEVRCS